MLNAQRLVWLAFLAVAVVLVVGCGDDSATGPRSPGDLVFYLNDANLHDTFYAYHPITNHLDTISAPFSARYGLTASSDGSRLYCCQGGNVIVADTAFGIITALPYNSTDGAAVSPDGRYVAFCSDSILTILHTKDFSIVYQDTVNTSSGIFSSDSKHFFCSAGAAGREVFQVSLGETGTSISRREFSSRVLHVVPSYDRRKWFLYLRVTNNLARLQVYDVLKDSVESSISLYPGQGYLELCPNGRYLAVSYPGTMGSDPAPSRFTLFDTRANEILSDVETGDLIDQNGDSVLYLPISAMRWAPDQCHLVALGGPYRETFIVFNLCEMKVERTIYVSRHSTLQWVTCKN